MQEYDMKESTNTILFTSEGSLKHYSFIEKIFGFILFKFFRHKLKLDYIFYKNCKSLFAKKLTYSILIIILSLPCLNYSNETL